MEVHVIKKGWVYRKSILWKARYSTIVDLEGSYFMNLFSDRMDGNPSVIIPLSESAEIEVLSQTNNLLEKIYPFKVTSQSQTHLLATKSFKEREEFVAAIRNIAGGRDKVAASILVNRDSAARLSDMKLSDSIPDNIECFTNQFYQESQIDANDNWDHEYQSLRTNFLTMRNSESLTALHQLKFKFRLSLEHFGKLLIDRLFNNPIPKNAENGWLFGQLFFYLAADYQNQKDDLVSKSHSQINLELSSTGLFSSTTTHLRSALMGSVEYKGFRVVGYANLPLKNAQIIHNASNSDHIFISKLNKTLSDVHLKPLVKNVQEYPDLEAYDANQNLYVVNLNCILPNMMYNNNIYSARPEFILKMQH